MARNPSLSVVLPAFNEERHLEESVRAVLSVMDQRFSSHEIIIVDDASTDGTTALADRLAQTIPYVKVIHHPRNLGMGHSLLTGFRAATKQYLGSYPSDNGLVPESWSGMLDRVGSADVVSYYIANPGFRSWSRRMASWTFVQILNAVFGLRLRYWNGHAIYRRELVTRLPYIATGHIFLAECLLRLIKQGCTHVEVPVVQQNRKFGKSKAVTLRNVIEMFRVLVALRRDVNRGVEAAGQRQN